MSSPSATAAEPGVRARSSGREAALVAASLVVGVIAFGATLVLLEESGTTGVRAEALLLVDVAAGILAIALMPLRRHAPVAIAVTLGVLAAMSSVGILAALITLVSVSTRRRPREIALVASVWVVALLAWEIAGLAHVPMERGDGPLFVIMLVLVVGLPVVIGLYVGGRRELLASLRERARLAEEEQALRLEQAADHERTRIGSPSWRSMRAPSSTGTTWTRPRCGRPRRSSARTRARRSRSCARCWACSGTRRDPPPSLPRSRRSPTSPTCSTTRGPSAPRCASTSIPARATTSPTWAPRSPATPTGSCRSA
jgi:hypothetical protein